MIHQIGVLEFLGAALGITAGFRLGQPTITLAGLLLVVCGAFELWMGA